MSIMHDILKGVAADTPLVKISAFRVESTDRICPSIFVYTKLYPY